MRKSTRERALAAPTMHSFQMGVGYFEYDSLPPLGPKQSNCMPPKKIKDGSLHEIALPEGVGKRVFTWVAKDQAWATDGGNRLAFTAAYLGSHGWSYIGPYKANS